MTKKTMALLFWAVAAASMLSCLAPLPPGRAVKSPKDAGNGPAYEAEKMGRFGGRMLKAKGGSGAGLEGPFNGVVLLGNDDQIKADFNFAEPGRYAFDIKGASSDGELAGATVFANDWGGTTVFFESKEGEVLTAYADVDEAGTHTFRIQLTTDGGRNDTLIDSVTIRRVGDVLPPPSPPSKGAFETGVFRNMFVEAGNDDAKVQKRVQAAYNQLFHGKPEEETVMYPAGSNENGPLAYIMDLWNGDVRSEGMSYGMMITVQMDRQDDFNAIWNWSKTFMYQKNPKHPCYGYFAWQMNKNGTPMDEMPAPDGEEYFIMSLFFASHRWGDGEGIYNYKKEALDLLDKYKNRKPITGVSTNAWGTRTITGVALMHPEYKGPRFTPDTTNFAINGDHTDPSYHLPSFYELFAKWGPEKDKAFWEGAAQASRDFFPKAAHKKTGLTPDYSTFEGVPVSASFNKDSDNFRWDAWRTAMNWGMDYHWFAKDTRQNELTNRIQSFFIKDGLYTHRQCYTLSGGPWGGEDSHWHSIGLASTNGAASLSATDRQAWLFVNNVLAQPIPSGLSRYYDGMLFMFGMLHLSGNYKIYMPGDAEKAKAKKAAAEQPEATPEAAAPANAPHPDIEVSFPKNTTGAPEPEAPSGETPSTASPAATPAPAAEPAPDPAPAPAPAAAPAAEPAAPPAKDAPAKPKSEKKEQK